MKVQMTKTKETKSKVAYSAPVGSPIDTVYVDKNALRVEGQKGYPESITIDITLNF